MWHDICFANRKQLLNVLDMFNEYLGDIKTAIKNENSNELLEIFTRAKQARDRFTETRNRRNDAPE